MKEIGGYFGIELEKKSEYHKDAVRVNSARSGLLYLIDAFDIRKIRIPKYTCPVVWETLEDKGCELLYYDIDENMLPTCDFDNDDYILYTNYFGVCDDQVDIMKRKYSKLIVDNSQSFYSKDDSFACFNSARKYFGVPDGGYLYISDSTNYKKIELERNHSWSKCEFMLKRSDIGAGKGYEDFKKNEIRIGEEGLLGMSLLTQNMLSSIDYSLVADVRINNFNILHENLGLINEFKLRDKPTSIPMVYPFLIKKDIRSELIAKGIFVATYWIGQKDRGHGDILEKYLLPLPIDQRYSDEEMEYIVREIKKII